MVSSTGTFVSCKDYDDDIDEINNKLNTLETTVAELQKKIVDGAYVKSITPNAEGFVVTMSDGTTTTIKSAKGQDGKDGTQWTITEDGYWACDGEKTDVKAVGVDGQDGQQQVKKENGKWYLWNGTDFEEVAVGASAATGIPYYYEDATDPNYTILVIYDENGANKKEIRLPMNAGLGQIVVLNSNLNINYSTFNGVRKSGKTAEWGGSKALPEMGEYMLTANSNAYYVQVIPADYDISKLNFKLVNTKGDVAPITLGTPVPCSDAVERAVSESGVYAIPFELNEMTDQTLDEYTKNIRNKALSLVATETVRSTYTNALGIFKASNEFGNFNPMVSVAVEDLGTPVVIAPSYNAQNVYDTYLRMDAGSKADSVKYGIKFDGMTISYNKDIKKGTSMTFVVNELNAKAMINPNPSKVTVVFGEAATTPAKEFLFEEQTHNAVAVYIDKTTSKEVNKQYLDVDFAEFFKTITPQEGDRIVWNKDVRYSEMELVWTPVDKDGNLMDEVNVANSLNDDAQLLSDAGKAEGMAKFTTLRIPFKKNYPGIQLGNGTLVAKVHFYNSDAETETVAIIPFVINNPTAAEIASWYSWNKTNNFVNGTLTAFVDGGSDATVTLSDNFEAIDAGITLNIYAKESQKDNKPWYTPNMTIGYPSAIFKGMAADAYENRGKAKKLMTWTGYDTYISTTKTAIDGSATKSDITGMTNFTDGELTLKSHRSDNSANADAYFNNAYTISGIEVKALGKGVKFDANNHSWIEGDDRSFGISNIKLVIKNTAETKLDQISFSKALQIPSVKNEYIKLSNALHTPNTDTFFGTFSLLNNLGTKKYELGSSTAIKVYELQEDGTYASGESSNFSAEVVAYEYGTTPATAQGIKLKYIGTESYTAGKTFTLKLTFSTDGSSDGEKLTLDGEDATEAATVEGVNVLVK
jgi:hypothetical protein